MKEVELTQLIPHKYDYKESSTYKQEQLRLSLLKFGQVKPILVSETEGSTLFDNAGQYRIIKGNTLYESMRQLGIKTAWIKPVGHLQELEELYLRNIMDESVREIDTLKYATMILELQKKHDIVDIAAALRKKYKELLVMVDILNLQLVIRGKQNKIQIDMFDEKKV